MFSLAAGIAAAIQFMQPVIITITVNGHVLRCHGKGLSQEKHKSSALGESPCIGLRPRSDDGKRGSGSACKWRALVAKAFRSSLVLRQIGYDKFNLRQ